MNQHKTKIDHFIVRGINFLIHEQQESGNFFSLSARSQDRFNTEKIYNSSFSTSLILSCLSSIGIPLSEIVKKKAANFLITEKSENWSFNYWSRKSSEYKKTPYPDDLDDTFCALSALYQYDKNIIDGSALAKIVMLLTATEIREGGPYRTWLVPPNSDKVWLDVDLAVNSNIAYFLSLQNIQLNNLDALIDEKIVHESFDSPYYPTPYPAIYFISRFYKGERKNAIIEYIDNAKKDNAWGNQLNTALAISSLLNLGYPVKKLHGVIDKFICDFEETLKPYPFCNDPSINKQKYCSGSAALTCALSLEALSKYKNSEKKNHQTKNLEREINQEVIDEAKSFLNSLTPELKKSSFPILKRVINNSNINKVTLLPYLFNNSLRTKHASKENVKQLGLANLYGWISYTIYDDFIDEEGDAKLLPIANVCMRNFTLIFHKVCNKTSFNQLCDKLINDIDNTNLWELENCRFKIERNQLILPNKLPYFGLNNLRLAQKSFGHALGPLAIMFLINEEDDSDLKGLTVFFENYLTAKQIGDDAHDWENDLKKGQINFVSSMLIKKWREKHSAPEINLDEIYKLQEIYWLESIQEICKIIFKHLKLAENALHKISLIKNKHFLLGLLAPLREMAEKALRERRETIDFLSSYKK